MNINCTDYCISWKLLYPTRALEHIVCLGESLLSQVNNSRRANVFPAGVANFGKAMYRSLERSIQDTQDGYFLYSAQASFSWPRVDLAWLLRRAYLGLSGVHPSSLSKSAGFVFLSGKASLVSISAAILLLRSWHVYFLLEFEFRGKSCSWMRAWRRRWHLRVSYLVYYYCI